MTCSDSAAIDAEGGSIHTGSVQLMAAYRFVLHRTTV